MKKNIIVLGIILSLFMAGFIFCTTLFPKSYASWALRLVLPGLVGLAALYFRSKQENPFPFFLTSKVHKLRLTRFLSSLVCGSSALILFVVPQLFTSFLVGVLFAVFSGIASALFWQGYVWPMMKKKKTLFRSACKLTLFQLLFMFSIVFVSMAPLARMPFLPTSLSVFSIAKLFNGAIFFASLIAGLGITLLLGALVNYWLIAMQERTHSILYPALAYGICGYVVISVSLLQQASHPLAGWGGLFMVLAGVSVFIGLYRGSNDKPTVST